MTDFMDKYLTKDQVKNILNNAPSGIDRKDILRNLVEKRGYTLEGFTPPQKKEDGLGKSVSDGLRQRNENIKDIEDRRSKGESVANELLSSVSPTVAQKVSPVIEKVQKVKSLVDSSPDVATGGQIAGGINDILGDVLAEVTPDKWKEWGKEKASKIAQTALGHLGINSIEKYNQWAEQNPLTAKNIEGVINIASLLPEGKVADVTLDAAKSAASKASESISRTVGEKILNPIRVGTTDVIEKGKNIIDRATPEQKALKGTLDESLIAKKMEDIPNVQKGIPEYPRYEVS